MLATLSSQPKNRKSPLPSHLACSPAVIIFDVDGVLVDVRESFHRTVLDTIAHYTGRRVSVRRLHQWKNRPGFNDDWKLTHHWLRRLGCRRSFKEVKKKFQEIYWGAASNGNVRRERWILTVARMERLSQKWELALFTGRTREELDHTLERFRMRHYFRRIVTVEDVHKSKPSPEGLMRILDGREPANALYVGDNVDDATAAQRARVAFLGVLPHRSHARRERAARLRALGARTILGSVRELETWLRKEFTEAG